MSRFVRISCCAATLAWSIASTQLAEPSETELCPGADLSLVRDVNIALIASGARKCEEYLALASGSDVDPWCRTQTAVVLAEVRTDQGDLEGASRALRQAKEWVTEIKPRNPALEIRVLQAEGFLLLAEKQPETARARFQKAIELGESDATGTDLSLVRSLCGLSLVELIAGHVDEAQSLVDRATLLCQLDIGAPQVERIRSSRYRGRVHFARKQLDQADAAFSQALDLARETLAPGHVQVGLAALDLAYLREEQQRVREMNALATEARSIFARLGGVQDVARCDELIAAADESDPQLSYESRHVNGAFYQIGRKGDLQVWLAGWLGQDLQLSVYVVNGSGSGITFYPESIVVQSLKETSSGLQSKLVNTYSAAEYEGKLQNRQAWGAALQAFSQSIANQPSARTNSFSGTYSGSSYGTYGSSYSSGSYYGTITTWPTDQDYRDANARTAAQMAATRSQFESAYAQISSTLMRTHTLHPESYFGGQVFVQKKGKTYAIEVPFGGETFKFSMRFE